jgi:CRP-like cAMP-binding protein
MSYFFVPKKVIKNQIIYKENEPADFIYIIINGEI